MIYMLIVRATKKLLDRIGRPTLEDVEQSTTLMGQWYATALFWKPHVALIVNETTLLPILMPFAPAATVLTRLPQQIADMLSSRGASPTLIRAEVEHMQDRRLGKTANRSVVGVMTEFAYLADVFRHGDPRPNLFDLSNRLAMTPCSPLYRRNVSPARELAALLGSIDV
jgi:hypothetical protein